MPRRWNGWQIAAAGVEPSCGGSASSCSAPRAPYMRINTTGGRFIYGPVLRRFRERSMRKLSRSVA